MKLQEEHISQIREAFCNMKDKEGFLSLLNYCKIILYGEEAIPFEMRQLNYHCNPKNNKNRYFSFNIRKKSGALRTIHAPNKGLKALQKCLNLILQVIFEPHKAATGFIPGKSVVDNAKIHIGKNYVYNIDLRDFFPSVEKARVYSRLKFPPFNLENERSKLANIISGLCCQEMEVERLEDGHWIKKTEYVLPQGAPTSPTLTNIICERLDRRLAGAAKKNGLCYSRYADDMTFSSNHNKYQQDGKFLKEVERIISDQHFIIKAEKTRLQKQGYRQEVTGLLVNKDVNVPQRYIKELRMWLYYWERYGYDKAYEFFLPKYKSEKGNVKKGKPDLINVLSGKLNYLKMVKGEENDLYLKLRARYDILANDYDSQTDSYSNDNKSNTSILSSQIVKNSSEPKNIIEEPEVIREVVEEYEDNEEYLIIQDDLLESGVVQEISPIQLVSKEEKDSNKVKVTLEIFNTPESNGKLINSINIPKGTLLPNTFIIHNLSKEIEDIVVKKLLPHNPIYTISFLKKFKIGDGSGFKELVHDIILSDETLNDILDKVKSHPNFILHYKGKKVANVSFLNRGIVMFVRELIDLFEKEGIPFYRNSHKHPFNNDVIYTNYAKKFKKKYRYGSGSEYSKLQNDIIDIFNDQRVPLNSLSFLPDERKFNIRSSFFTWQPSIYSGIRYIVQGISDHSNINGECAFNETEKKILVEVERIKGETRSFIELRILDCKSVSKNDSETLLQYFKGSFPYKNDFRNLCDWIVECDFLDESSKRINLLVVPDKTQLLPEIENLPFTVGGFKHILKFYDVS